MSQQNTGESKIVFALLLALICLTNYLIHIRVVEIEGRITALEHPTDRAVEREPGGGK